MSRGIPPRGGSSSAPANVEMIVVSPRFKQRLQCLADDMGLKTYEVLDQALTIMIESRKVAKRRGTKSDPGLKFTISQ